MRLSARLHIAWVARKMKAEMVATGARVRQELGR